MSRKQRGWLVPLLAVLSLAFGQMSMAAVTAGSAQAAPMGVTFDATDPTKVPHYFGPYPNWANSPQTLADAIVTLEKVPASPGSVGNALVERAAATDSATAPGTLGPVFVVLPNAKLPAGTLSSSRSSTRRPSGRPRTPPRATSSTPTCCARTARSPNKYTVVYDSGELTVPAPVDSAGEVSTFALGSPVAVQQDDVIGFYGEGVPLGLGDRARTPTS